MRCQAATHAQIQFINTECCVASISLTSSVVSLVVRATTTAADGAAVQAEDLVDQEEVLAVLDSPTERSD